MTEKPTDDQDYVLTIDVELEDGTMEECEILDVIEFEGKQYVALLPMDSNEYHVYECSNIDDESISIASIEDEALFEKVITAFEEYFNVEDDEEEVEEEEEE